MGSVLRLSPVVLIACMVMGLLVMPGASALAAAEYEFSSSFGLFAKPEAVAVDQSSHDVYVIDTRANVVEKLDAAGSPANFSSSQPYIKKNELTGTPSGAFSFDSSGSAAELAVDNSGGSSNGDLYVTDSSNSKVDVFASDGSFLGEVNPSTASPQEGGEPCGVAVDPSGNVYVGHFSGHVDRYSPVDGNPAHDVFSAQLENVGAICQVAVNSAGDVYVDTWTTSGPLLKYEPSQFGVEHPSGTEIDSTAHGVAVNPANEHVFVDEQSRITEFDASGSQVGLPFGGGVFGESAGVGIDGSSANVYASDRLSAKVDLFVVPVPSAPVVKHEFVANVTSESAELRAEVNPKLRDTKYFFRYGTNASYADGDVPAAPGADVGAGSSALAVHVQLRNLAAGSTYHYQIVAENELGTTHEPDRTFTTFPPANPVLPDNRGWEMVSPLEKLGADITGIFTSETDTGSGAPMQASPDGDLVTYVSLGSFADPRGAPRGSQYLSTRGPEGWSTQNLTPSLVSASYASLGHGTPYKAFSLDLSAGLLINGDKLPVENTPLVEGVPPGYQDFYLHGFAGESFQALLISKPSEEPTQFFMELEGTTPDLSHVVFSTDAALTMGTVDEGQPNLYEWANGQLQPVNVLPGGEPAPGAQVGSGRFEGHTVSDDGSRVFWSYNGALYVHESGVPATQIDASKIGGEGGHGTFLTASTDGSRVFFTDGLQLTSDSTAHGNGVGEDLYKFNTDTHQLTDITVDKNPEDNGGAAVEGVLGAGADGSYVYFVAKGSLAGEAVSGENNLYVWHEGGETKFIAALAREDEAEGEAPHQGVANDWNVSLGKRTARVTPSGEFAVFMSAVSLTGYDNTDLFTGKQDEEVYLYDARSGHLICVSCNPSGERPIGPASIPAGTHTESRGGSGGKSVYQPRAISEDGSRVFFETSDALVLQDTNSKLDVYEYEDGHAYLLSGGTSSEGSSFVDASANGSDAFFVTRQQLVPQDTDALVDLYDARENGGFPTLAAPLPPCGGESCKSPVSSQPVLGAPSSMAIGVAENLPPSAVAKHKARAKHKTKPKRRAHKRMQKKSRLKAKYRKKIARARTGGGSTW
jgi:hypothetical protein